MLLRKIKTQWEGKSWPKGEDKLSGVTKERKGI